MSTSQPATAAARIDTGLACLALLARYHGLAADPARLRHELALGAEPCDAPALLLAAKRLGLRARRLKAAPRRLEAMPLPAIAAAADGEYFLIADYRDGKALVQHPREPGPRILEPGALEALWSGELILARRRAPGAGPSAFGWRWFVPEVLRYRRFFGEVLLASLFVQLFALATPLFFQVVVDKVLVHRSLTTLDVLAVGLLLVSVFDALLNGLRDYLLAHTGSRIDVRLGARLFRHLLSLPLAYFEVRQVGHSVARVRELETLRRFITGSSLTLVIDLFFTLVFVALLLGYSPVLTAVVLGCVPAYVLLSVAVTPALRARLEEKFQRGAENQAFLVEAVSGIETLKSCAVEPQAQRRWEDQLAAYVSAGFRAGNLANLSTQLAALVNRVGTLLVLWIGARLVIDGALSVGQLVAFNMIAGRIGGPILKLVNLWQDYQQVGIALGRLGDILDVAAEPGQGGGRVLPARVRGEVRLERVAFRYRPDGPDALEDLSVDLRAGEVVGIVGPSGSGKSTLAKLVQRCYLPQRGRVLIDGMDLAQLDPAWLRRQIGVVPQQTFLFNRSVRENIALADPGAPLDAVVRAARLAGAHEFVLAMAAGYDTLVEEQGTNLSGGQRQRLAIARALMNDPRILVFDEATSALDYESERVVQDNMQAICRGRTVLVIAHRLSAVRAAHRILVIDRGRLVEDGCHADLLARGGRYAAMYRHQSGLPLAAVARSQA